MAETGTHARVRRFDVGTLRPAERLGNGWLRVDGLTARVGILVYEDGSGAQRRELVLKLVVLEHRVHPSLVVVKQGFRAHPAVGGTGLSPFGSSRCASRRFPLPSHCAG